MSEPFVGEIRMFAGNFAPQGWAFCDGQLLAVSQNDALFSLLGTTYGGDGRTTFALPDCRGRIPIHQGAGPGLTPRPLGSKVGSETETLTVNEMPVHNHGPLKAVSDDATSNLPEGNFLGDGKGNFYSDGQALTGLSPQAVSSDGRSQSHSNMMPYLCVNFIISLFGIYPSRN